MIFNTTILQQPRTIWGLFTSSSWSSQDLKETIFILLVRVTQVFMCRLLLSTFWKTMMTQSYTESAWEEFWSGMPAHTRTNAMITSITPSTSTSTFTRRAGSTRIFTPPTDPHVLSIGNLMYVKHSKKFFTTSSDQLALISITSMGSVTTRPILPKCNYLRQTWKPKEVSRTPWDAPTLMALWFSLTTTSTEILCTLTLTTRLSNGLLAQR